MVRQTQDAQFDPVSLAPSLVQYGLVQLNEPQQLSEVDTRLSNVSAYLEQEAALKAQLAQSSPDYWAEFLKGANVSDWSPPGQTDLEQLAYQGGEFASGLAAEPTGVVTGGATGTVIPGVGNIAGAAIGGELANQSFNNVAARRSEYLRQLAAGETPDTGKQDAAAVIQQAASIIPFTDDVSRGIGLAGKVGKVALNALKQAAVSGGTSALTDLETTGKVDANKTISNAVIGAGTRAGGDVVTLTGDKLANAGKAAADWATQDMPKGPGFGSMGYPGGPNEPQQGKLFDTAPYETGLSTQEPTIDGNATVLTHPTPNADPLRDILAPYRGNYYNGLGTPKKARFKDAVDKTWYDMLGTDGKYTKLDFEAMAADARKAGDALVEQLGPDEAAVQMTAYTKLDAPTENIAFAKMVGDHIEGEYGRLMSPRVRSELDAARYVARSKTAQLHAAAEYVNREPYSKVGVIERTTPDAAPEEIQDFSDLLSLWLALKRAVTKPTGDELKPGHKPPKDWNAKNAEKRALSREERIKMLLAKALAADPNAKPEAATVKPVAPLPEGAQETEVFAKGRLRAVKELQNIINGVPPEPQTESVSWKTFLTATERELVDKWEIEQKQRKLRVLWENRVEQNLNADMMANPAVPGRNKVNLTQSEAALEDYAKRRKAAVARARKLVFGQDKPLGAPRRAADDWKNYLRPDELELVQEAELARSGQKPERVKQSLEKRIEQYIKRSGMDKKRVKPSTVADRLLEVAEGGVDISPDTLRYIFRNRIQDSNWTDAERTTLGNLINKLYQARENNSPAEYYRTKARIDAMANRKMNPGLGRLLADNSNAVLLARIATQTANLQSQYAYAGFKAMAKAPSWAIDRALSTFTGNAPSHYINPGNGISKMLAASRYPTQVQDLLNQLDDWKTGGNSRPIGNEGDYFNGGITSRPILGVFQRTVNLASGLIDRPLMLKVVRHRFLEELEPITKTGRVPTDQQVEEAASRASMSALHLVFQGDGGRVANIQRGFRMVLQKYGVPAPIATGIFRFAKTSGELMFRFTEKLPTTGIKLLTKGTLTREEQHQFSSELGMALTAGAIAKGLTIPMALYGAITTRYAPENPELNAARDFMGRPQLSYNQSAVMRYLATGNPELLQAQDGDQWDSYAHMAPLKEDAIVTTALVKAVENGESVGRALKNALSDTAEGNVRSGVLANFNRAYQYKDPETGKPDLVMGVGAQLAGDLALSVSVPGGEDVANLFDKTPPDRKTRTPVEAFANTWLSRIPGIRNFVRDSIDPWGNPIEYNSTPFLPRAARQKKEAEAPAQYELVRIAEELNSDKVIPKAFWRRQKQLGPDGVELRNPDGTPKTDTLPDSAIRRATKIQGDYQIEGVNRLRQYAWYKNLPTEAKEDLLARMLEDAREAAAEQALGKVPKYLTPKGKTVTPDAVLMQQSYDAYWGKVVMRKYYPAVIKNLYGGAKKAAQYQTNQRIHEARKPTLQISE